MPQVLVLLDYQKAICGPGGLLGEKSGLSSHTANRAVVEKAAATLEFARQRSIPVIHVGVAFDPSYANRTNRRPGFARFQENGWMLQGSVEAAFLSELSPVEGELVIYKGCVDPFVGTGLLEALVRLEANDLVICGTATNYVVESTARHAGDMGFAVTVLEDLCASYNDEMHKFAVRHTLPLFSNVSSSQDWREALATDYRRRADGWAERSP